MGLRNDRLVGGWSSRETYHDTFPPASYDVSDSSAGTVSAEKPKGQTDSDEDKGSIPALVGREEKVGKQHDPEKEPELSEPGLPLSKQIDGLLIETVLLEVVDQTLELLICRRVVDGLVGWEGSFLWLLVQRLLWV